MGMARRGRRAPCGPSARLCFEKAVELGLRIGGSRVVGVRPPRTAVLESVLRPNSSAHGSVGAICLFPQTFEGAVMGGRTGAGACRHCQRIVDAETGVT